MKSTHRRGFLRKGAMAMAATAAVALPAAAQGRGSKKIHRRGKPPTETPLFNPAVSYGNLLFLSGKGAHFEGDIKAHTTHVLDSLQQELENAGSSMEKVVKVNVYLNDLADYQGMNEVFRGRFGPEPPVRTTIAAAGGIPGNSLVEIDCIAYI